jgi:predicted acylesterase/phospholipase RssA
MYVDGGTVETVPLPPFFGSERKDVLIVKLSMKPLIMDGIGNIKDYIGCIVRTSLGNRLDYGNMYPTIDINLDEFNLFDFNMSPDDKLKMYMKGVFLCSNNIK